MKTSKANLALALVSSGLCVLALLFADHLSLPYAGLIYQPNTSVTYQTTEYQFVVHTNELGFRGPSTGALEARKAFRVMVLGDSFTYGWGVDYEDSWPALLEEILRKRGLPAEVLNLGWAGRGPNEYADVAARSIPVLRPDLVIVAVLQAEDLYQVQQSRALVWSPRDIARRFVPNLSRYLFHRRRRDISQEVLREKWKAQAVLFAENMSSEETRRFRSLDPKLQELFTSGRVSPYLVFLAVSQPGFFQDALDLDSEYVRSGIAGLAEALGRIRDVASRDGAKVIVTEVPYGIYLEDSYLEDSRRLGFEVSLEMHRATAPGRAIALAAERAGLPFYPVVEGIRHIGERIYFPLDQHFNPLGNKLFAEAIAPTVEREHHF